MNWTASSKKGIFRNKNQDSFVALRRMIEKKKYSLFCMEYVKGIKKY